MTIECCCDRNIPSAIKVLTAYQNREPIRLRIISNHLNDFEVDGQKFSERLLRLITHKQAQVSILVDRLWIKKLYERNHQTLTFIKQLEDMGVKILTIWNLHAKIICLNSGNGRSLLLGSANFSPTGMNINHEADIYFINDTSGLGDDIDRYITDLYKNAQPIDEVQ